MSIEQWALSIPIYCTKFQIRQARRLARWTFISTSEGKARVAENKTKVAGGVLRFANKENIMFMPFLCKQSLLADQWSVLNTDPLGFGHPAKPGKWFQPKIIIIRLWSKVRGEDMSWEQAKQVNKYLFILKEKYVDWGEQMYRHWRIFGGQRLKENCISDYWMYCRFSSAMRAKACSARSTIRMCGSSSGSDWCRNFTLSQLYLLLFPRMPRDLVAILNGGKR